VTARTAATPVAAVENPGRRLYGVQFHPEVLHTQHGMQILRRFLDAAGCRPNWTMRGIIEEQTERVAEQIGDGGAICGLSGGVDSAVAAAIVQRAIGSRLSCVFVDHGLLRQGEAEQVEKDFDIPRRAGRGHRPGGKTQDHRTRVHPGLRARGTPDRR
jgi:GMP synthase (glutamine-hydrolysing)